MMNSFASFGEMMVAMIAKVAVLTFSVVVNASPDGYMYNNAGMLGGDIAGGYSFVKSTEGKITIVPDTSYTFWPGGIVYYEIHQSLLDKENEILEAMDEFHKISCVRFVDRNGDPDIHNYLVIRGDLFGCWSYMGMYTMGSQEVSLQKEGCIHKGIMMHELMHALGFWHEHQRYDRDTYIDIIFENLPDGFSDVLDPSAAANKEGVPYDFDSIMHYELEAFSSNGEPGIWPKHEWVDANPGYVADQDHFSVGDFVQINSVYCQDVKK